MLALDTDVKAKEKRIEYPPIVHDCSLCATRRTIRFASTSSGGISDWYHARDSPDYSNSLLSCTRRVARTV
ncbi:hypothetical protein HanIR_Chr04g0161141 [Helianthus annuus]|nr:hypothetical protein HanIR_Chr04g0161141 [Helianthus annuus]